MVYGASLMKPDDNLINITPVPPVPKRTEAVSCPTRK